MGLASLAVLTDLSRRFYPKESGLRVPQPAAVTLAVEHRHVFGGCREVLRVSPSGVSFISDNARDVFAFKYDQFEPALGTETLTIKSDQKTYRFKAASVTGRDENRPQLRKAMNAITGFQKERSAGRIVMVLAAGSGPRRGGR